MNEIKEVFSFKCIDSVCVILNDKIKQCTFFVTVVDIGVVAFDILLYPNVSKCIVVFSYHVK